VNVTVEKLSPVVVEFQVEVPSDRVKAEVDKAIANVQRSAHVKGYRPGKAPRQVIEHLYGGRVHQDVAQRLVDETLQKALAEKAVQPLSKPAIAPTELRPTAPFAYKARFEVRPEIAEVSWKGFSIKRPKVDIEGAAIDGEIETMRKNQATLQAPDEERAAKDGDVAEITFTLSVDGKVKEAVESPIEAELGSNQIVKELDSALGGMKPGEEKDVEVIFPDRHPSAELRGKKASFHVVLKGIKERVLPALDDEFAKDCGDYADLAALREAVKGRLEAQAKQKSDDAVAEQLVIELCKANPIPVPPSLVEQQASVTERELAQTARRAGQRFELTQDLHARVMADSEVKVRAGLLMAEIARLEQIKIGDADLEKGYAELAQQTGKNVAKVKAEYRDPKKREMLLAMILEDKILDLLEGAAVTTEAS
jgi:trigger factor